MEADGAGIIIETQDIWDTYTKVYHYQQNITLLKLIYSDSR